MGKKYTYSTNSVCARSISFEIEDGKIRNVSFEGGCDGNLQAVSKLVEGQDALRVAEILKGNNCKGRGTSCADQLSQALVAAIAEQE